MSNTPQTLLVLLQEIRPLADYGRVGTKDIDQKRYQEALDSAIALLTIVQPAPLTSPTKDTLRTTFIDEHIRFLGLSKYYYELNYRGQFKIVEFENDYHLWAHKVRKELANASTENSTPK